MRSLSARKDGTALVIGAIPPNLKLLPSNRKHLILLVFFAKKFIEKLTFPHFHIIISITIVRFKEGLQMNTLPQISEAEFEVMKVIWKHAPISTNEITEKLTQTTKWSPKTIQTLIKRLVTKGALSYEKQSRVFVYTPLIEEKEYIGQESHSFLKRYYDGDIMAMLSAYIEDDKLSESEIDTLRSLLAKGSKDRGN